MLFVEFLELVNNVHDDLMYFPVLLAIISVAFSMWFCVDLTKFV